MVADDVATGRFGRAPATRFPPEPNGFLHMGHAKSICLNFGIAQEFGGTCNLRFDDTNPATEDIKYVEAIQRDVQWLGFQWDGLYYASDYFEKLYDIAEMLVQKGKELSVNVDGELSKIMADIQLGAFQAGVGVAA
jgi:glutaminyl-tRNA synthetase